MKSNDSIPPLHSKRTCVHRTRFTMCCVYHAVLYLRAYALTSLSLCSFQVESGVNCPLTMTYAAVAALAGTPEVAEIYLDKLVAPHYDGTRGWGTSRSIAQSGMYHCIACGMDGTVTQPPGASRRVRVPRVCVCRACAVP